MEWRYGAGEERRISSFPNPSSAADGYFFSGEALRLGFHPPPPPLSETEIEREALFRREIARRRVMEEEIAREMDLERRMAFPRREGLSFHEERRLLPLEQQLEEDMRYRGPPVAPRYSDVEPDMMPQYRDVPSWPRGAAADGRRHRVAEPSSRRQVKLSDQNVSGVKRKPYAELSRPARRKWHCSLCHVGTTGQEALEEHFQGKRHKAREAALRGDKATAGDVSSQAKGRTRKDKTEEEKQQHLSTLFCDLCKIQCNSQSMMALHLKGKKHLAQLELQKEDKNNAAAVAVM